MVNLVIIPCVFAKKKKKVYCTACVCECVRVWRGVIYKCQLD